VARARLPEGEDSDSKAWNCGDIYRADELDYGIRAIHPFPDPDRELRDRL